MGPELKKKHLKLEIIFIAINQKPDCNSTTMYSLRIFNHASLFPKSRPPGIQAPPHS